MNMQRGEGEPEEFGPRTNALRTLLDKAYFHRLPSYGNTIFYGLGFLALTCLVLLGISGLTLAFMGQTWWLTTPAGIYVRSFHLWTVQAFIFILILHALIGFTTSGFKKPRRMVWVFGATIFCLALLQTEFGYGLRGDFSAQFRAVSGADFWNGAYLGYWVNPLSHLQEFALHVAIIPFLIFVLFIAHYLLEHSYGIAKPYRKDIPYTMEPANHRIMYVRGLVLIAFIATMAFFFHSPYVPAITIQGVAQSQPDRVALNMLTEYDHTSDTATYMDSIDPYTFDTRTVYITVPYDKLAQQSGPNALSGLKSASPSEQAAELAQARQYLNAGGLVPVPPSAVSSTATSSTALAPANNQFLALLGTLVSAAQNGTYAALLNAEHPSINDTYTLRFLNDMNVFEDKAKTLHMDTEQWGMAKDETGGITKLPPGSWWLTPLGFFNWAFDLPDNPHGDGIAAGILFSLMLVIITFPYIPFLNRLPEAFRLAPFIWRRGQKR